jgi:hypothetical protein
MTTSAAIAPEQETESKLSRRDWILLPLFGLLTIVLLLGSTELVARLIFPEMDTLSDCMVSDLVKGLHPLPNSACFFKRGEHPVVKYKFNSCGHYAAMDCGPKQEGVYRIVMTGSSYAMGYAARKEQTFASLLPEQLSRQTGRRIELYNEGLVWKTPRVVALRFDEVLVANPDMILWIVTPWDVKNASSVETGLPQRFKKGASAPGQWALIRASLERRAKAAESGEPISEVRAVFGMSRAALLIRHFLYQSQSQYLKSYLTNGDADGDAGYLKAEMSAEWKIRVSEFDSEAAEIEARAKNAGVPFVVAFVPNRPQALMVSTGEWPEGYDPYKLDNELRKVVMSHGGIYVDTLPDFRTVVNPEQGYLPVDDHPNSYGHAIITKLLTKELTSGAVPALKVAAQPQAALERSR